MAVLAAGRRSEGNGGRQEAVGAVLIVIPERRGGEGEGYDTPFKRRPAVGSIWGMDARWSLGGGGGTP